MTRAGILISGFVLAACASPGVPPGGPVDTEAPKIVRIVPDSGKVGTTPPAVIFRFDEVVSEHPSGAPSLGALFLISPRDGDPRVGWHRQEVSVRAHRGWRKNTAYTITLLPGLSDLRGNIRNTGAVTMFATGSSIPASRIIGTLFNWQEGRAITRGGLIEARPRTDTTLVYVAATDTLGNFALRNLPPGDYVVRGIGDDNNNRGLDPREVWDTAGVRVSDSAAVELYAFVHDSLGSRIQTVTIQDSVTVSLAFDNPLAASPPLTPAQVRVRASDSTDVGVLSVTAPALDTSAAERRLKRPVPSRTFTIRLSRPLVPLMTYRIRVIDARNLMGVSRSTETLLRVPAPAAPPVRGAVPPAAPRPTPPAPIKK